MLNRHAPTPHLFAQLSPSPRLKRVPHQESPVFSKAHGRPRPFAVSPNPTRAPHECISFQRHGPLRMAWAMVEPPHPCENLWELREKTE